MAVLRIYKNNEKINSLELTEGSEFIGGRGTECQIQLDPEPGISRQHFKVLNNNGQWIVEVLSRFGELYFNNEKMPIIPLSNGVRFSVPPYDFLFEDFGVSAEVDPNGNSGEVDLSEKTTISALPSVAYLLLNDERGGVRQSFRLEGDSWVAGRDTNCSIFLDNQKVSRQQFEMYREGSNYFVRDLGSANGTLLNGQMISSEDGSLLTSGDVITAVDWNLSFELRDAAYSARVNEVSSELKAPVIMPTADDGMADPFLNQNFSENYNDPNQIAAYVAASQNQGYGHQQFQGQDPSQFNQGPMPPPQQTAPQTLMDKIRGQPPIRLILAAVIFLALIYGISEQFSGPSEVEKPRALTPFDRLPLEQQQIVKQTYARGLELYQQLKYELASQEMIRLHAILESGYQDSKQIAALSQQALQNLEEQRKLELAEKERLAIEEKILKQVEQCKVLLIPEKITPDEMTTCLEPVLGLNLEHPQIVGIRSQAQSMYDQRMEKERIEKEYRENVKKRKEMYEAALAIEKEKKWRVAIKAYEQVIASELPDPEKLKDKSKNRIEKLKSQMARDMLVYEKKANALAKDGKYKEAIIFLKNALKLDPENFALEKKIASVTLELTRSLQPVYQESVIEENLGDFEAARAKWKKIMLISLPFEEYYKKARTKLRKYEALEL